MDTELAYYDAKPSQETKLPLTEQDKAIAGLNETISQLKTRLAFILTPGDQPKISEENATVATNSLVSPLQSHLMANTDDIIKAVDRIIRIMDRLEI